MTYDWADGYVLLFGGLGYNGPLNDTWTYADGIWTNITTTAGTAPPAQYGMAMTYDFADGYVLAWGCPGPNPNASTLCNDTWSFAHGHWNKIDATVHLPSGESAGQIPEDIPFTSMTYDAAEGYILLTDGSVSYSYLSGVWTPLCGSDGSNCTESIAGPPEEDVAYDATDGYVLSFGGVTYQGSGYVGGSYTWKFSDGGWTNITSTAGSPPPPRVTTSMVYDNASGGVLLFGGSSTTGRPLNDTWLFQDGTWHNETSGLSPQPRYEDALAYDAQDEGALVFGGIGDSGVNSTWYWGSSPPIAALEITTNDTSPLPGAAVSFGEHYEGGSGSLSYSWEFGDGGSSSAAAPTHTYLSTGYFTIRLWVNDSSGDSASVSLLIHVYHPLTIVSLTASPDPAPFGTLVNFSVEAGGGTPPYAYGWQFGDGGTGGNLSNISHAYTTDGPFEAEVSVTDSSGGSAHGFVNVTIQLTALAGSSSSSGAYPFTVDFIGQAKGGVPPYVYSWAFGDGSNSTLQDPDHTYNASGTYRVELTVTDSRASRSSSGLFIQVVTQTGSGPSSSGIAANGWILLIGALIVLGVGSLVMVATIRRRSMAREGQEWIRELTESEPQEAGADPRRGT